MTISQFIPTPIIQLMRRNIEEAEGHEVLWVAHLSPDMVVKEIHKVAEGTIDSVSVLRPWAESGDAIIHNHPSGNTHPSKADIEVAHQLGEWGVGFFIVNNDLTECRLVAKPILDAPTVALQTMELAKILKPGGRLSQDDGYEYRSGQVDLLEAIAEAFNQNQVLVAEAGTGIGKSFAYLIPALSWAVQNKERVVITTGTINLQRQILEKDIPKVQNLLGTNLRAELVKGRGNYLCPARLNEALREADPEQKKELKVFENWAKTTPTGDREDFSGPIPSELWQDICSEKEICAGYRCGLRDDCFVSQARKRAASAQILVVNHHLLFADLSLRLEGMGWEGNAILPPFRRLVIDEAHKIEESASSYFSQFFSRRRIIQLMRRLFRQKKRKRLGVLALLEPYFPEKIRMTDFHRKFDEIEAHASAVQMGALQILGNENFFWIQEQTQPIHDLFMVPLGQLVYQFLELVQLCQGVLHRLPEKVRQSPIGYELQHLIGRIQSLAASMSQVQELRELEKSVYWLEKSGDDVHVNISPMELGPFIYDALFKPIKTVTAVSATLTVRNRFDYFVKNCGADQVPSHRLRTEIFPSPFDYHRRVLLAIPRNLSSPDQKDLWFSQALTITRRALEISGGGALLLFTSFEQLREARSGLEGFCALQGINLYYQGQSSHSQVLQNFNKDINSILLATYSFWEGVDSPGDTLRLLIIFKLPFSVPTDPVRLAKSHLLTRQGKNPFLEMSLPEAVIRLKQGFGRLMRRGDDGGVVLMLDSRLVSKFYGEAFLESLPPAKRAVLPIQELDTVLRRHYLSL